MRKFRILLVAGARPNFMKIAPLMRAMEAHGGFVAKLVHTGQHYDASMSEVFFRQLGIPDPDYHLGVGSASHAQQTAEIMRRFEPVCRQEKPDAVIVVGDVNSTIAAGLVAVKLGIRLVHVEAGLRSGDRSMPEEINRLATDAISDCLFATEPQAVANLLREGHGEERIHFVGHVMIDNLFWELERLNDEDIPGELAAIKPKGAYVCLTLHRPANVDHKLRLQRLLAGIRRCAALAPVLFPCHPRTMANIRAFSLEGMLEHPAIHVLPPLAYRDFLWLWKDAAVVITDSGGLQEETTALGIPCLTLRDTTERPITVECGTNMVIGDDTGRMLLEIKKILTGKGKKGRIPELWDGKAGTRIAEIMWRWLAGEH